MEGKVLDFKPKILSGQNPKSDLFSKKLYDYIYNDMEEVEACLKNITDKCPLVLKQPLSELLYIKGGRLVASLFLISCLLFGQIRKNQHQMAASLEALYLALNIHELLKPDCKENDKNQTEIQFSKHILCGDYLLSFSLSMIADYPEFVKGMSEIICRNVEASFIESSMEAVSKFEPSLYRRTYLQKISHKSGSPFALSCALAGWSCGIPASKIELLAYYGHYIGLAKQIGADLLDFEKNIHRWLVKGRGKLNFSLPLIYMLEISPFREKLLHTLSLNFWGKNERELWEQELNKNEYKTYINTIVHNNCKQAISSLSSFPYGDAKEILLSWSRDLQLTQ